MSYSPYGNPSYIRPQDSFDDLNYTVTLKGRTPGGGFEDVGKYFFRVLRMG
ncbi:MAG TPA: hypothetical protein VE262_10370 [Blastocatellia bacterium]|nr:hypothetical protein [Blastocatellia bacterium]